MLDIIQEQQIICVGNNNFVAITVPLTAADGTKIFLGLQTTERTQSDVCHQCSLVKYSFQEQQYGLIRLATHALAALAHPNFYYGTISPTTASVCAIEHQMDKLRAAIGLSQEDINERKSRLVCIPASSVLSPLYLTYFEFAPVINEIVKKL